MYKCVNHNLQNNYKIFSSSYYANCISAEYVVLVCTCLQILPSLCKGGLHQTSSAVHLYVILPQSFAYFSVTLHKTSEN